jgi:hypothetical protein
MHPVVLALLMAAALWAAVALAGWLAFWATAT